jgi:hypothetical protein
MSLQLYEFGFTTALVFFGFYCLSLGYLVFKSAFLPRIIGVLLAIGGLAYLTGNFANFLSPAFAARLFPYYLVFPGLGEGSLILWLLIMGVNAQRWKEGPAHWGRRGKPDLPVLSAHRCLGLTSLKSRRNLV